MRIVSLPTQIVKAKDGPLSSELSIIDPDPNPSTHPHATPHPRSSLLKLCVLNDSSNPIAIVNLQ